MSVTLEQIVNFTGEMLGEVGGDPAKVEGHLVKLLGTYGFDPEAVTNMGQTIINLAVAQGEEPEPTIMAAWMMGVVLGAALGERP